MLHAMITGNHTSVIARVWPQHHKPHLSMPMQTAATSSYLDTVTDDSDQTESDLEDDMTADNGPQSSLASNLKIDEAVTGYLQDNAASEVRIHRTAEQAFEQVMLSHVPCS